MRYCASFPSKKRWLYKYKTVSQRWNVLLYQCHSPYHGLQLAEILIYPPNFKDCTIIILKYFKNLPSYLWKNTRSYISRWKSRETVTIEQSAVPGKPAICEQQTAFVSGLTAVTIPPRFMCRETHTSIDVKRRKTPCPADNNLYLTKINGLQDK